MSAAQMNDLSKSAVSLKGPALEDWKKNTQTAREQVYLGG